MHEAPSPLQSWFPVSRSLESLRSRAVSRPTRDKWLSRAALVLFLGFASGFAAPGALACATCFGRADSPLAEGMNMGILVLLGVVLTVLAAFASFFVFLARRAAAVRAGTPSDNPTRA